MLYEIGGIEIHSENAARSSSSASSYLLDWLSYREFAPSALDFGCGKLRYTGQLALKSSQLGIVDSNIQLSRIQKIFGEKISVKEFVKKKWPSCRIHSLQDFLISPDCSYNFVLCANVLSAIPCPRIRAKSLRAIYSALRLNGYALFVNQHSNSYFPSTQNKLTVRPHLDGWITDSRNGGAYYGILTKDLVVSLMTRHGFTIERAWVKGQSNFVLTKKEKP